MKTSLRNLFVGLLLLTTIALSPTGQAAVINGNLLENQDANGGFVSRTVDFIKFSTIGGLLTFDVLASDQPNGLDDAMIWLFNDDGQLDLSDWLAENDDSDFAVDGNSDGSSNELDAFLSIVLAAGQYQVAIGTGGDFGGADMIDGRQLESSAFSSGLPAVSSLGLNYQLTVGGDFNTRLSPIPLPASIYFMVSGLGLALAGRKMRRG